MLMTGSAAGLAFRPLEVLVLLLPSTTLTPLVGDRHEGPLGEARARLAPAPASSSRSLSSRDSVRGAVAGRTQGLVAPISILRTRRSGSRRTRSMHSKPSLRSA